MFQVYDDDRAVKIITEEDNHHVLEMKMKKVIDNEQISNCKGNIDSSFTIKVTMFLSVV